LLYLPAIVAFLRWRRNGVEQRRSRARIDRLIGAGLNHAINSVPIRNVLIRTLASSLAGSSLIALTPLVARELLAGGAVTYGLLLTLYGVGAVAGTLLLAWVRERAEAESLARTCAILTGATIALVGLSHSAVITAAAMAVSGGLWLMMMTDLNVAIQLTAPRRIMGRVLACYVAAFTGGMAFGAWGWGAIADARGIGATLLFSGAALAATALLGLRLPLPRLAPADG
jgi:predicted MFS family arabinose efflux permease